MAGKRLLDAAKLFSAGRAVTKQHLVLRKEQWDLYTRTSGLARAVKNQTDRFTVTVGAAVELAKRFNETAPSWEQGRDEVQRGAEGVKRRAEQSVQKATLEAENLAKDIGNVAENAGFGDVATSQASAAGQSADDGTLASLRKREQQRQSEAQIPSQAADTQPGQTFGQDTFNERSQRIAPELSSLPRKKLPLHAEDPPSMLHASGTPALNPDTFPSPGIPNKSGEENLPDGVNINAFHSPRISRMLGQAGSDIKNPYAKREKLPPKPLPEMVEAAERRKQQHNRLSMEQPAAAECETAGESHTPVAADAETRDLAASISQGTQPQPEFEPKPYEMHESRVPATRFGRLWQYGGLATSMAFGAVGEGFRRFAGGSSTGSLMLSEGNMNRLVAKLSRMRGAALKLGQMMSFQDSKILPSTINTVLQRVQDSADYMPASQRDKVLARNLGNEWRGLFSTFEEKPFAAASIGQVHKATLKSNGNEVAVKVQYPGVRNSIDSDLNNLSLLLTASQLLPRGLFLDKTIANARTELGWECDYEREAKACIRFKEELLVDEPDTFTVPTVYTEASGADVLTAEFMHGSAVTKIKDLAQDERDWIGTQILRLCLRELMEWRFMQTDPNWTNFLYNRDSKKLELLDFGASREFPDEFVEPYVSLLIAASRHDREACRDLSIQLGYLTGQESKDMLKAHVDSILTLAEPFVESAPEVYDFEEQTITDRVRSNIGLMLKERLAPPPEETYSLHRKLSGAFLLCARLKSKVPAREMFASAVKVWNGREKSVKL
ncbi:ABC1, mitochondrial [Lecanosticta acicola]|uniref:ABC1, mitochondrial n=1 Tax=Lecanosticta acicola TaxID=111012 RepID=A0AAI8YT26_9PEZI|nr:ABC1, mitochondrial [Lecanosticta acicola]